MAGLVGRRAAVPYAGLRADSLRPSQFLLVRHHVPFPGYTSGRCAGAGKAAADGKDVRLGGGTTVIREFLEADLVDTLHIAVSPIELGRGERLWDSPDDLLDRFIAMSYPGPAVSFTTSTGGADFENSC